MNITRQLRLDALAADGTVPMHLLITWEGNRLGTGAVVRPEHWDAEARQVKAQQGTPHASINPRLNRAHKTAEPALETAHRAGRKRPRTPRPWPSRKPKQRRSPLISRAYNKEWKEHINKLRDGQAPV